MSQKHLSGICQADKATGTIKECDPALVLKRFDLLTDRRLGEMEMCRRRGKTRVRCHFLKGNELT